MWVCVGKIIFDKKHLQIESPLTEEIFLHSTDQTVMTVGIASVWLSYLFHNN